MTLEGTALDELVERVALRVVELLEERRAITPGLVGVKELSEILGVSRSTVYEHAARWGGLKVGGALRFDWTEVKDRLRKSPQPKPAVAPKRKPGRPRRAREGFTSSGAPLLPIHGVSPDVEDTGINYAAAVDALRNAERVDEIDDPDE